MKLIVIYATANRGKTSMLEETIRLLQPELTVSDKRVFTLFVNGVQIGIALDGDDEQTVRDNLEAFINAKCNIIITPSHVRDGTVKVINEFAQKYKTTPIWIKKAELSYYLKDGYDELNKCEAKYFVDYLKHNFI